MKIEEVKALQLEARKNRQTKEASLYGLILGEYETKKKRGEAVDVVAVVKKMIKSNLDTARMSGPTDELEEELHLLNCLLPKQLTRDEVVDIVEDMKLESIGQIMAALNKEYSSLIDNRMASEVAKEYIKNKRG